MTSSVPALPAGLLPGLIIGGVLLPPAHGRTDQVEAGIRLAAGKSTAPRPSGSHHTEFPRFPENERAFLDPVNPADHPEVCGRPGTSKRSAQP